jgi:signal transduction histidine kinase
MPEINRLKRLVESHADRISALSHETRTPLALIKGASDLLLEGNPGPLTEQQQKFINTISQNGEHLIKLADDILIQARIDAGIFHLRLEPVDFISLLRQNVNNMRFLESDRQQLFHVDCPQVIERVYADPRLMTQVMYNLIRNACRHTSHGGNIYIKISENDGDDLLIISVTDDGAGMTPEERNHIFERFYSSRALGDGTGLGLLITRQIVELHCGHLMVDTSLGKGTTVLFTLPRLREKKYGEKTENISCR